MVSQKDSPKTNPQITDPREPARALQEQDVWEQNELRCRAMKQCDARGLQATTYPEAYDEWDNELRYFALLAVYQRECLREGLLRAGRGPFYCPACEETQPGWRRLKCWECGWPETRNHAIEMAQQWARTEVSA